MSLRLDECVEDLDDLNSRVQGLNKHEYNSGERTLQVLIESCIGLAKHWVKQESKVVPNDAYAAMEKLHFNGHVSVDELKNWRRVIGMRNALVHDYLNLDKEIIRSVITEKYYLSLVVFARRAIVALGGDV